MANSGPISQTSHSSKQCLTSSCASRPRTMKTSPLRLPTRSSSPLTSRSKAPSGSATRRLPRGQLWLFSRDQLLSIFYISRNKNTVFVSVPEDHLLYGVLVALQEKLKAINPDIKDILREPNDPNNPKFIVLHTEYTHEGGRKKGDKDSKKGGWNSADKKSMSKEEALADPPVVLEQWIINVQKVTAHDVVGLTPFLKLEKAFIKLPDVDQAAAGSGGDQSMLDAID